MKKTPKKMTLQKETLLSLTDSRLQAAGGRPTSLDTVCEFCDTYQRTCTGPNTCGCF
ncbi:MAG: class I lanthipeptide [Thermoanaerobaculia bacterium]|jgi:hypothetical protein